MPMGKSQNQVYLCHFEPKPGTLLKPRKKCTRYATSATSGVFEEFLASSVSNPKHIFVFAPEQKKYVSRLLFAFGVDLKPRGRCRKLKGGSTAGVRSSYQLL